MVICRLNFGFAYDLWTASLSYFYDNLFFFLHSKAFEGCYVFSAFDFTSLSFLADLILKLSSTIIKGSIDEYLHKFCYFLLLKQSIR